MTDTEKGRLVGLNHVALEVRDLDEAIQFLEGLFDLRFRSRGQTHAFVDMGDQFLALAEGREQGPDTTRHFGLVVDDAEKLRRRLREKQVDVLPGSGLDFLDPSGNHFQVVDYRQIQFTKTPSVLSGMGLDGLGKTEAALAELADKGLAPD